MTSWAVVAGEAPELMGLASGLFAQRTHHTMATLRTDGSPRISGTEVIFTDGELWIGCMWQSLKARDLQRDPRVALHSGSQDPPQWRGDAKVAGRAVQELDDDRKSQVIGAHAPPGPNHLFRIDLAELVVVRLGEPADHLVIESWHRGRGTTRVERR